jgi:hypothetical protein
MASLYQQVHTGKFVLASLYLDGEFVLASMYWMARTYSDGEFVLASLYWDGEFVLGWQVGTDWQVHTGSKLVQRLCFVWLMLFTMQFQVVNK